MSNPNSRKLFVFKDKVIIEDYLIGKSETTDLTYTLVYTGPFTDFAIQNKVIMNFSEYKPTIFNGGYSKFSCTSLSTIGEPWSSSSRDSEPRGLRPRELHLTEPTPLLCQAHRTQQAVGASRCRLECGGGWCS